LSCQNIFALNHTKIAHVFSEDIQILWPDIVELDEVFSRILEATPVKEALEELSMKYHRLMSVTCVVHVLTGLKNSL
jgi:hypothetical protein